MLWLNSEHMQRCIAIAIVFVAFFVWLCSRDCPVSGRTQYSSRRRAFRVSSLAARVFHRNMTGRRFVVILVILLLVSYRKKKLSRGSCTATAVDATVCVGCCSLSNHSTLMLYLHRVYSHKLTQMTSMFSWFADSRGKVCLKTSSSSAIVPYNLLMIYVWWYRQQTSLIVRYRFRRLKAGPVGMKL